MTDNIMDFEIFSSNKSTMKEVSADINTGIKIYMTESELVVVNFDSVKDEYAKSLKLSEFPKSNDALYRGEDNKYIFIEFKNGYMDSRKGFEVKKKIYDSLLIFSDITDQTISQLRKKMSYILVYNYQKNENNVAVQGNKVRCVAKSAAIDKFGKSLGGKAQVEIIKFGLEMFKGYCFREVHTYTEEEFEDYLKLL